MEYQVSTVLRNMTKQIEENMEKMSVLNKLLEDALKKSIKISIHSKLLNEEDCEFLVQYDIDYTCKGYLNDVQVSLMLAGKGGSCYFKLPDSTLPVPSDSYADFDFNKFIDCGKTKLVPDIKRCGKIFLKLPQIGENFDITLKLTFPHPAMEGFLTVMHNHRISPLDQLVFTKIDGNDSISVQTHASRCILIDGMKLRNILGLSVFDSINIPSVWVSRALDPSWIPESDEAGKFKLYISVEKRSGDDSVEIVIKSDRLQVIALIVSFIEGDDVTLIKGT